MKRFPKAALVTANILMLVALACSNDVVGPVQAALANVRELISPEKDNALEVAEDGLLYVAQQGAGELVSEDSANVLRRGSDDLLFVPEGKGKVGPQGPQGEKGEPGPKGDVGPEGPQGPAGSGGSFEIKDEVQTIDELGFAYFSFPGADMDEVIWACYLGGPDTGWYPVDSSNKHPEIHEWCYANEADGTMLVTIDSAQPSIQGRVVVMGNFGS